MRGAECEPVAIFLRSVPQMPQVCTRTRISPAAMEGTGTVSIRTSSTPRYTAACMVAAMVALDGRSLSCVGVAMSLISHSLNAALGLFWRVLRNQFAQQPGERGGSHLAIALQMKHHRPQMRTHRRVQGEARRLELAIGTDELL